jgi:serine O-acetyltransferase
MAGQERPGHVTVERQGAERPALGEVVDALAGASDGLAREETGALRRRLPSPTALAQMIEDLRSVLFPGYFGASATTHESVRFYIGATLDRVLRTADEQVKRGLCFICKEEDPRRCPECESRAREMTWAFLGRLPEVRRLLALDVQAAYEGDPAATLPAETILCYPGILGITNYRLAHELYRLGVPLLPRMITEHAHSITGIDIHPGASIGERFFIDHGTGVVIGETAVIGDRVRLYQGVTLGARSFPVNEQGHPIKGIPRHPIVEDDVIIYGGATVLGRITIGRGSVVGGNVWLTHSVPPNSRIAQVEVRQLQFSNGGGI